MENIEINTGGVRIFLKIKGFDEEEEVDIDKLLQIDFQRLPAEVITFPVILNRLGILLADSNNKLAEKKIDFETFASKRKEELRIQFSRDMIDLGGKKKPHTVESLKMKVDFELRQDKVYIMKNKLVLKQQKIADYLNTIYWSAKDKSDKLNKLSEKIRPESLDSMIDKVGEEINGILIKVKR